ncbi:hypothetical protein JX265_001902 [Neoarthrinium moseri]|uniref:Uncharacterized protein n=1 Tax=Neoarthrinium moseri TaxID=1658444 RepID=A0A9P9WW17_9PEZI|nr:hypothetical protein JX265_001902 [Neoarthrinium moseri]
MSLQVYLAISLGMGVQDHHAILVDSPTLDGSSPDASLGHIYQVTGNIQSGMAYEHRPAREDDISLGRRLLGTVEHSDLERFELICQGVPPPRKQFDGPRRMYPREPLRRCQEWVKDALDALRTEGVLQELGSDGPNGKS